MLYHGEDFKLKEPVKKWDKRHRCGIRCCIVSSSFWARKRFRGFFSKRKSHQRAQGEDARPTAGTRFCRAEIRFVTNTELRLAHRQNTTVGLSLSVADSDDIHNSVYFVTSCKIPRKSYICSVPGKKARFFICKATISLRFCFVFVFSRRIFWETRFRDEIAGKTTPFVTIHRTGHVDNTNNIYMTNSVEDKMNIINKR